MTLSWTAPTSDRGAGISGYLVYQGTSPGGEAGTPVNGSPVSATSYTVTGLANGTTYYFKVAAVNDAKQQGNDSGEASATSRLAMMAAAIRTTKHRTKALITATDAAMLPAEPDQLLEVTPGSAVEAAGCAGPSGMQVEFVE